MGTDAWPRRAGTRMTIANGWPGVNTNVLSPPTFIDEPSGNGALNGIPVTVTAVGA
ncbi:hypothetical protein [Mycobacterium sp.]|uniref:hypothetical protein n=1 Tax=Mycobacterium sp. TaxID=1785 RepID=UPI002CA272F8|nr:hypothetical protein [Mycobacterium sp.]HKP42855.1 hypothetical protein [Mycobacterium sp.]